MGALSSFWIDRINITELKFELLPLVTVELGALEFKRNQYYKCATDGSQVSNRCPLGNLFFVLFLQQNLFYCTLDST